MEKLRFGVHNTHTIVSMALSVTVPLVALILAPCEGITVNKFKFKFKIAKCQIDYDKLEKHGAVVVQAIILITAGSSEAAHEKRTKTPTTLLSRRRISG
jgi:hypothetical protein